MSGRIGNGMVLNLNGQPVADVIDGGRKGIKRRTVKANSNDNPDTWDRKIASFADPGQVTFNIFADSASAPDIFALIDAGDEVPFSLTLADEQVWAGNCIPTDLDDSEPLEDLATMDVVLEVTGTNTFE